MAGKYADTDRETVEWAAYAGDMDAKLQIYEWALLGLARRLINRCDKYEELERELADMTAQRDAWQRKAETMEREWQGEL